MQSTTVHLQIYIVHSNIYKYITINSTNVLYHKVNQLNYQLSNVQTRQFHTVGPGTRPLPELSSRVCQVGICHTPGHTP